MTRSLWCAGNFHSSLRAAPALANEQAVLAPGALVLAYKQNTQVQRFTDSRKSDQVRTTITALIARMMARLIGLTSDANGGYPRAHGASGS